MHSLAHDMSLGGQNCILLEQNNVSSILVRGEQVLKRVEVIAVREKYWGNLGGDFRGVLKVS